MKKAIVSVDLDELYCYYAIHAIKPHDSSRIAPLSVERFLELFDRCGIKGIFFTVGSDLDDPETLSSLRRAASLGHEIGCHTFSHHYDLIRRKREEIIDEVARGKAAIEERLGVKCVWFRAPGYNINEDVLSAVADSGFLYDSSILPSLFYYAARAFIIAFMKIRGGRSRAIVGNFRHAFSARRPFKIRTDRGEIEEFPISVLGPAGIPLIGTTLASAPEWLFDMIVKRTFECDYLNVEFHAIDLMDIEKDRLDPRLLIEPALRKPLPTRIERFSEFLISATKF